ncbi:hypothetical protein H4R19_000005 [Coemansia spiralis]|nr:hypothetical protein H4R19_000005 [Coemansia spiralis]
MPKSALLQYSAWLTTAPVAKAAGNIWLGGLYRAVMAPCAPLIGIALYLATVTLWSQQNQRRARATGKVAASGAGIKPFVIAHSVLLAAYSVWVFADYSSALAQVVRDHGLRSAFYDSHGVLWSGKLLAHGFLFYLSKYYELIDTAIILAKGRPASRLQTFHHSGAIAIMWLGNYTQSPYLTFFVLENSLIHSLMYVYYTLTAVGIRPPGKQLLTSLQIAQFYVSLSAGIIYAVFPAALNGPQRVFTYLFVIYTIELVRLFTAFSRETYGRPHTAAKKYT